MLLVDRNVKCSCSLTDCECNVNVKNINVLVVPDFHHLVWTEVPAGF